MTTALPCDLPAVPETHDRPMWLSALPVAAAIGVFGMIYGAIAEPILGSTLTVASSVIIFSGAGQFAMIGLISAGHGPLGVLAGVVPLALRHLPLGAIVRSRIDLNTAQRARLSFYLIDETVGLMMTARGSFVAAIREAGRTCYAGWVIGTVAGVAGAAIPGVDSLAGAVFPLLFIGLVSVSAKGRSDVVRAVIAALGVAALLTMWPGAGVLGAIAIALGACAISDIGAPR